ncbi:glycine betaine/L-proline ABC transporter ATP-binding protein [Chloroflexota bacterium]
MPNRKSGSLRTPKSRQDSEGDTQQQLTPKVQVHHLWKVFGKNQSIDIESLDNTKSKQELLEEQGLVIALKDVSLDINQGETFVIMGLSGSGKSTLLRCINRLIQPTRGEVTIDSDNVTSMGSEQLRELRRHKMSMVFQHFALLPFRSIVDNVAFGLELRSVDDKERREQAEKMLALVGLEGWGNYYPEELSGGMQQRVGLARALATNPDILLLDEPFSALDPLIRREMQDEFLRLVSVVNKTVIFVTHDLNEALKLGDRVAIMQDGKIVQVGSPKEIMLNPSNDYVKEFVRDVPKMKVLTARSVMEHPGVTTTIDEAPASVLKRLEELGEQHAFVVDNDGTYQGAIRVEALKTIVAENKATTESIIANDVPQAEPELALEELAQLSTESDIAVVIVDRNKKLRGIVPMASILRGITDNES